MKFRTRVIALLLILALATNGVLLGVAYFQAREQLIGQMRSTVLSIAATAAALVDGDQHKQIQTRADESTPLYRDLETKLRAVRDANRRDDVYVKYLYTMTPHAKEPRVGLFTVDSEENPDDVSHVGDVYKARGDNAAIDFDKYQVQPGFVEDQWGVWLTANAPIRDHAGQPVGVVGVDVRATDVIHKINLLLVSGGIALAVSVVLAVIMAVAISRHISEPLAVLRRGVEAVAQGNLDTHVALPRRDEFGEVAQAMNAMIAGLRQRKNLIGTLACYVSNDIADKILESGQMPALTGDRRKITVLFADVRGFTTISETRNPEQVVGLLNGFFEKAIEAIFKHRGMLNKFLGDGLMAVFGAPLDDPYQEENAIRAALEIREQLEAMRAQWKIAHDVDFRIGIGINTGTAIVGNIGSAQRMEYTAIGDTVNLAARLESSSKDLGTDIVVSEYTYVTARGQFPFTPLGSIHVKGRTDSITVYGLKGLQGPPVSEQPEQGPLPVQA